MSTTATPKRADVSFRSADLCFITPFVARRTFSLNHPFRNRIKTKPFSTFLKIRFRFHFLTFATFGRPGALPWRVAGPFWAPLPFPEISERLPWSPWALPRTHFGLTLIDPRPTKNGSEATTNNSIYTVKTLLFEKLGFETPPVNDWYSFWALLLAF